LIGVPLLGVWFFARHNISGYNSIRERTLLASDLEWDRFWRRAKKEYDPAKARTELTPAAWIWDGLSTKKKEAVQRTLQPVVWGNPNPVFQSDFGKVQTELMPKVNERVFTDRTKDAEASGLQSLHAFKSFQEEQVKLENSPNNQDDKEKKPSPAWPALKKVIAEKEQLGLEGNAQSIADRRINRLFLEASYPDEVSKHTLIRRTPLIMHDQWARCWWMLFFIALFTASALLLRINRTSMHQFYRDQLSKVYILPGLKQQPESEEYPLSKLLDAVVKGGPYHLICPSFNTIRLHDSLGRAVQQAGSPEEAAARPPREGKPAASPPPAAGAGCPPEAATPETAPLPFPIRSPERGGTRPVEEEGPTDTFI